MGREVAALTRLGADLQASPQQLDALLHADQADAGGRTHRRRRGRHIKSAPVVFHRENDHLPALPQRDLHPIRAGVFGRIGQRFLQEAIEADADLVRQRRQFCAHVLNRQPGALGELAAEALQRGVDADCVQRGVDADCVQRGRPQVVGQKAYLLDGRISQINCLVQFLADPLGVRR